MANELQEPLYVVDIVFEEWHMHHGRWLNRFGETGEGLLLASSQLGELGEVHDERAPGVVAEGQVGGRRSEVRQDAIDDEHVDAQRALLEGTREKAGIGDRVDTRRGDEDETGLFFSE